MGKVIKLALKKKLKKVKTVPTRGRRSNAQIVLAQGTGRSVQKAFGKTSVPRQIGLPARSWDAFDSCHAALPRSVGPYTVIRTSSMIATNSRFALVGSSQTEINRFGSAYPAWSNFVVATEEGSGPIAAATSTACGFHVIAPPGGEIGGGSTFTCCPAAISVQIMGEESLQNATGQLAAAVVPARIDLHGDTRSWADLEQQFVSYFRPRLMSAGKLSLRGVQLDSMPLSMNDVSEFLPMNVHTDVGVDGTGVSWQGKDAPRFKGWAPMAIYNPNNAKLTLLVSVEWRVRFDVSDPAVASHSHHGVTSDSAWEKHIQKAHAALPGVIDIVEKVANTGIGIYNAVRTATALV